MLRQRFLRLGNQLTLLMASLLVLGHASYSVADPAQDWPDLYEPTILVDLHLEMAPDDWSTIVGDLTFDIEVPAVLSSGNGADSALVSVRRKSAELLGTDKVSLKVDINEYTVEEGVCDADHQNMGASCVEKWHGVKKLSLENGDDNNVITEGLAWYLNRVAAESGLAYTPGYGSWVTVTVNGDSKGVYVNVEQRDKQWLKNHGLWAGGAETWLYKYSDIDSPEIKVGPDDETVDSPLFDELCYLPFQISKPCSKPADFKDQLNAKINMESLLTLGAVAAFMGSPDDLYNKDKNFYFVDYLDTTYGLREYVQWDLDSAFTGNSPDASIYNQGKGKSDVYEEALIEKSDAPFRAEYDAIMWELLDGPFTEAELFAAFDAIEGVIGAAVDADPNNQMGQNSATTFADLKAFITARRASAISQLPPPPVATPVVDVAFPADGSTVADEVTVTADASDPAGDGVTQVEFFIDSVSIGIDTEGDDGWSASWVTSDDPDGGVSVSATATNQDNRTATDSVTVTVDNIDEPPSVNLTNPVEGSIVSGIVEVTADASGDRSPVAQVEFFINSVSIGIDTEGGNGWSASWVTNGLTNDLAYIVSAKATDSALKTSTDSVSVTVDNAPPAATMHVAAISGIATPVHRNGNWVADVTVTVNDDADGPVANVLVEGTWTGGFTGGGSCTTEVDGSCSLSTDTMNKKQASVTFTVDTLVKEGYVDESDENLVTVTKS